MTNDIAEKLAEEQRQISVSEFFEKNKHMLGFDSDARALVTTIKEALDNALDVCEDMEILPDIYIDIERQGEYLEITVEDNGPGIPEDNVGSVFGSLLYGSRFGAPVQSRGQQGIGISAAVLYSQLTTNSKATVTSLTPSSDKAYRADVGIDTEINEPTIENEERIDWKGKEHGTMITLRISANLRARDRLIEYLENTNVANPHARIAYNGVKDRKLFKRATDKLPEKPQEIKPHPHGIEKGDLKDVLAESDSYSLKGSLKNDFSKVGDKTADQIISKFKDSYYGREVPKSVKGIDVENIIEEAISGKSEEDVEAIIDGITESIKDTVTKSGLVRIVSEVSGKVEQENDTRIGDTVRENIIDDLWEAVIEDEENGNWVKDIVNENTTSRKSSELISLISEKVYEKLEDYEALSFNELNRLVSSKSEEAANELNDSFGEKAVEKVVRGLWEHFESQDVDVPKVDDIVKDAEKIKALSFAMNETQVNRPSSKCLSPITPEELEKGLKNNYDGEFYATAQRNPESHSGHPFIVEAGLVYNAEAYSADSSIGLDRFANRVPLVYQQGACQITRTVKSIGWRNYSPKGDSSISQSGGSGSLPQGPFILVVHVASTNVPFTSESKDAITGDPTIGHEIERAVRDVARELKSYLKKQTTIQKKRNRRNVANQILPPMAKKFAGVANIDVPDTGLVVSNITDSILVKEKEDTVNIYNKIGSRRKMKIILEGIDSVNEDSDFTEEDGEVFWEELVHSSTQHNLNVGGDYDGVKIEGVDSEKYMVEEKNGDTQ